MRRHRAHYDVIVMSGNIPLCVKTVGVELHFPKRVFVASHFRGRELKALYLVVPVYFVSHDRHGVLNHRQLICLLLLAIMYVFEQVSQVMKYLMTMSSLSSQNLLNFIKILHVFF